MQWFERRVVASLVDALDPPQQAAVTAYVEGALSAMPAHLRFGVAGESALFGVWATLQRVRGWSTARAVDALDHSTIPLVRQWVRLLRSLVIFASHELAPTPASTPAPSS